MTTNEHNQLPMTVEETIELLTKAGYKAAICDTWVKEYDVKLRCGTPEEVCSESYDWIKVPKSFVGNDVRYYVRAKGDSMVDQGICDGDKLLIRATEVAQEEDIVVAMINNECTIKVFYRSDEGEVYLVPRNEKYLPILVRESDDFSIVGVVEEVIKAKPRVSGRICRKIIKDAKLKKALSATLTENMVKAAIMKVAPKYRILANGILCSGCCWTEAIILTSAVCQPLLAIWRCGFPTAISILMPTIWAEWLTAVSVSLWHIGVLRKLPLQASAIPIILILPPHLVRCFDTLVTKVSHVA